MPGAAKANTHLLVLRVKNMWIGTSQGLFLYYEGAFYDISPLATAITGATFDTFSIKIM